MKTINQLTTMMNAWCFDNAKYVKENQSTYAEHMINECESTDWNWFMEDEKADKYTSEDIQEVKEFLKDWDYFPGENKSIKNFSFKVKEGELIFQNETEKYDFRNFVFRNALKKTGFGQDYHSEEGTPNYFVLELRKPDYIIDSKHNIYESVVLDEDRDEIYVNSDYSLSIECAEIDGRHLTSSL